MPSLNARALLLSASCAALIGALFVFATGPLRSLFGDVVVIVFLVSLLASASISTPARRVAGIALFALSVEGLQGLHLVGRDAHWLLHLTVGSTPDPLDLGAYAVGIVLSALAERWYRPRRQPRRPPSGPFDRRAVSAGR